MPDKETVEFRKLLLDYLDEIPRTAPQIAQMMQRSGVLWRGRRVTGHYVGANLRYLAKSGWVNLINPKKYGKKTWVRNEHTELYGEDIEMRVSFLLRKDIVEEVNVLAAKMGVTSQKVFQDALKDYLGV